MNHVCAFRHALALDELRVKFLPEYANGGAGPDTSTKHIKEVWFAGSHSDMYALVPLCNVCPIVLQTLFSGGGNIPNPESTLFGPALRWMSYEAISCGLKMQPHLGEWSPITDNVSMNFFWKILEYIPLSRLSYQTANSVEWWYVFLSLYGSGTALDLNSHIIPGHLTGNALVKCRKAN